MEYNNQKFLKLNKKIHSLHILLKQKLIKAIILKMKKKNKEENYQLKLIIKWIIQNQKFLNLPKDMIKFLRLSCLIKEDLFFKIMITIENSNQLKTGQNIQINLNISKLQ